MNMYYVYGENIDPLIKYTKQKCNKDRNFIHGPYKSECNISSCLGSNIF